MVISSFKSVIQTCPFTGVKHPWKSSICVYISIEHIFQDMVNSCYVTWRVDLFWRWKRRHQTQRKNIRFLIAVGLESVPRLFVSFIFWKGKRGVSCVRCMILLFDTARLVLTRCSYSSFTKPDINLTHIAGWWSPISITFRYAATGDETTLTLMCIMEHQVGVAGYRSDDIDLNDAKYISIRVLWKMINDNDIFSVGK